ncbi:MAG: DUF4105 domain-containing protein [Thermodesulfobacteriota bacterium]
MKQLAGVLARLFLGTIVTLSTIWACLAIVYSDLPGDGLKTAIATGFAAGTLAVFILVKNRKRALAGFMVVFALLVAGWTSIEPSNSRDWQPDVAVLPHADVQGSRVTVHNIRNIHYRTETDFDVHYYDKTFDLDKLDSLDLIAVYWMGDAIAHIMISFGFQEQDFLTFSIETRKEKDEAYSTLKGFFKQYELIYIAGDERDLIRVRTDYRRPPEDVYLYRTKSPPERARKLFMEYIRQINAMKTQPAWYNTLTTNCTTNVVMHVRTFNDQLRYNWKILLSGYTPQYIYELGGLDNRLPFEKLRRASLINPQARAVGDDPEFSRKIREGLPLPPR